MNKRYLSEEQEDYLMEDKDYISNKYNNDLFDDESYVAQDIISARRVSLPKNGEDWEILKNNRVVMTINGLKLSEKEKSFLRSVDGFQLLISEYKAGLKSVLDLRKKIKKMV